jgi:hypothetical protein
VTRETAYTRRVYDWPKKFAARRLFRGACGDHCSRSQNSNSTTIVVARAEHALYVLSEEE